MQAAERGVKQIRLHLLTDGRDCTDGSSVQLMQQVVKHCHDLEKKGCDAKVASGGGRMKVTMDRYEVCSSHAWLLSIPWYSNVATGLAFTIPRRRVSVPLDASLTACFVQSDWNIVKRGYDAAILGEAPNKFKDPVEAVKTLRVSRKAASKIHGSSATQVPLPFGWGCIL